MDLAVTQRLTFARLTEAQLDAFHRLALDPHVRQYLLDGQLVDRAWCAEQLRASDALFAARGVGLWLVSGRAAAGVCIGFCGFIRFDETGPEPQLLYALLPQHTGRGYATEIASALVAHAREHTPLDVIHSGVDEPNRASMRVLEKLGFEIVGAIPGAFGRIVQYRLALGPK